MRIFSVLFLAAILCSGAPSDLSQTILSIQNAIEAGNWAAASRLIGSALAQHPNEAGLLNLRGIVHAQQHEIKEARKDFADAVRLSPDLRPAWQNLARACQLEAEEDPSAAGCAVEAWQRVLRWRPTDSEAHRSLALLYERQGNFSRSLSEIGKLPVEDNSQLPNLLLRCADLAGLGRSDEAAAVAAQIAPNPEFLPPDFESIRNAFSSPRSAPVVIILLEGLDTRHEAKLADLQQLAAAYEQMGRFGDARHVIERVAALEPRNTAHLLELARLADRSKDYEGALGYLAHARDLAPENAQIHYLFAMIASKMELPVEARSSLQRALALQPENPDYNFAMGFVILSTRDAATAAQYFKKFVEARPQNVQGHYALGIAYFASGDDANSKAEMLKAKDNPKTAGGAEYFLGRIALREDNLEEAALHLRKSIELLPDYPESHTELARVWMLEGKLAEAQAELERALHLDSKSFRANEQLLVLYKRTHDGRAAQQAEIVKKLDEDRSKRAELMLRTIEVRP